MMYKETIAVCSDIYTTHINTLRGQKVKFFTLQLVVYKVTIGL